MATANFINLQCALRKHGRATVATLARECGMGESGVRTMLYQLEAAELVCRAEKRTGKGRHSGRSALYWELTGELNLEAPARAEFRRMRLHHWQLALEASATLARAEVEGKNRHLPELQATHAQWVLHMGFVQCLNELFPHGDTAERDIAKEKGASWIPVL